MIFRTNFVNILFKGKKLPAKRRKCEKMKRSADHFSDRLAPIKSAQVARFSIEDEDLEGYTADKHSAHFNNREHVRLIFGRGYNESVLG